MTRLGETEEVLANNYLGVIYQSSWDPENQLDVPTKSLPSRILKRIKRLGRYLQSYI
jgi:hypothetical protein